ncbi:MAG: penicillin-binding protein 2 [Atribacterota bacterium]|jgi:stage V sporulation protein D (sporulation-specific penicillin-binding protein)|nr:penicillin-binding protein 2 [Atribacterota bacterium]MDI9607480.1 penicillin-binding protein 2 [Atribacterota bacterium]MDY0134578.1 penicillin-binding protein 2 [Atribacterota bacterium]
MISRKFVRRANFLFFLSLFLLGVVAVRVFSLQVLQGKFYREEALSRLVLEETLPSRGSILDRSGKVLAEDVGVLSISAYPPQMDDPEKIAEELSQLLSLSASELQQKFQSGLFWIEITDNAPLYLKEALEEKKLKGISWKEKPVRFYPQAPLFSNLLGFVGKDRQGLEGLEFAFDSYIAGKPGYTFYEKDALGREIPLTTKHLSPQSGNDLLLTVDSTIQFFAEEALDQAMEKTKALRGVVIVNNPQSGDILAMVSRPSFDNRNFQDFPPESWKNLAISMVFEPGSTVKPLVMAAALEEKKASLEERFFCPGFVMVYNHRVRDIKAHGEQKLEDLLINSCNVGIITLAERLGKDKLFYYLKNFGLGEKCDIGLPGEEQGLLRPSRDWSLLSIGAIPIGQEMMVTPLQLLRALSALTNKGVVMQPRLVSKIISPTGEIIEGFSPVSSGEVVSERTASLVLEMMEKTVKEGTGKKAYIEGYRIGGKTGTGQKVGLDGRYDPRKFYSSFVGFFPLPEPRFGIIIVLDEPQGEYYGGDIAAPVFREIAQNIINYAGIMSDEAEVGLF